MVQRDLLHEVARRSDLRVLVLAGEGRAFCAGLDLASGFDDPAAGSIQKTYTELRTGAEAICRLRDVPQPVIAAVQGLAIGAGFSLACAAELRVVGRCPEGCRGRTSQPAPGACAAVAEPQVFPAG